MSCSKRPKPFAAKDTLGITIRPAEAPPLTPAELRLRIRLLAGALVDVWVEGGGLEELREEARNAGAKQER